MGFVLLPRKVINSEGQSMSDYHLPFFTNIWTMMAVFTALLFVMHVVLVYWLKLGKVAWKRVDYVWLGFTVLGLIGASAQARQVMASNFLLASQDRVESSFSLARYWIDSYNGASYICRKFVRSQYSPPPEEFERLQKEYDVACGWFKSISATVPVTVPKPPTLILWNALPAEPPEQDTVIKGCIRTVRSALETYDNQVREHDALELKTKRSEFEFTFVLIFPLLLAFALALRITKVTGEIRLEYRDHSTGGPS